MSNLVKNPFPVFTDNDGTPLDEGYVYIGTEGLNPIVNPINVYWDSAFTIPATNIRTMGGYAVYQGSPGILYAQSPYSIVVKNKKGEVVFSALTPPDEVFDSLIVSGTITVGATGQETELTGTEINFQEDDINYIWAETVNGYVALGTNGRAKTEANANIVLELSQKTTFNGNIVTDGIEPLTPAGRVDISPSVQTNNIYGATGVGIQAATGELLKSKVLDIGPWDMDTTATLTVPHGESGEFIKYIQVVINNDDLDTWYPIDHYSGATVNGSFYWDNTNVYLERTAGGAFDDPAFDSAAVSRGTIVVIYES